MADQRASACGEGRREVAPRNKPSEHEDHIRDAVRLDARDERKDHYIIAISATGCTIAQAIPSNDCCTAPDAMSLRV